MYSQLSIVKIITSRRVRWKWRVACKGETRNAYKNVAGKPERSGYMGDGRIILK
jgi:hypothetical protein